MKRRVSFPWILVFIIPCVSLGQTQEHRPFFEQISRLRGEIARIDETSKRLSAIRKQMESQLEELAGRIQERKNSGSLERLIPDFNLQEMLRQSHDRSESLSSVLRQLDALQRDRRVRINKLDGVYEQLLDKIAKDMQSVSGKRRAELLGLLGQLRQDRDSICRQNDSKPDSFTPMDTDGLLASSDPEELIERADALRDEQDRLRRRLADLEKRITELKKRRRIDRQLRDFKRDQLLFAERSRNFQQTVSGGTMMDGDSGPNSKDVMRPLGEIDSRDISQPDILEPGTRGSSESFVESMVEANVNGISEAEEEGQPTILLDHYQDTKLMSVSERLRILTRARDGIIQQVKRLQVIYDCVMEKAESLETD